LEKNHKVVVNNWFNSPKLQQHLANKKTYAVGTVQKKRNHTPAVSTKLKKGDVKHFFTDDLLLER